MKTRNILSILFAALAINVGAQNSNEAKLILDKFAEKSKSFSNMHIRFTFTLDNRQENVVDSQNGELYLADAKYKFIMKELRTERIFDGTNLYTYYPDMLEANIETPENTEEGDLLTNPAGLFDNYSENYKYKYSGSKTNKGIQVHEIELFPKLLNKSYSRIILLITENFTLQTAQLFSKDGNIYTFDVNEFNWNLNLNSDFFDFNNSKYPDVEIIDLR